MKWEVIDTGRGSAERNMALDGELLMELSGREDPVLHLYEWEGASATYGHFIDPYTLLNREKVDKWGLQLAKRPTGGGIIFHLTDFAFSVLVPASHPLFSLNTLENYQLINEIVLNVVQKMMGSVGSDLLPVEEARTRNASQHFCMAKPTKYDVMFQGKKIGGAAQRKTKFGYLHQGSISLAPPPKEILQEVLLDTQVYASMQKNSAYLINGSERELEQVKKELKESLIAWKL